MAWLEGLTAVDLGISFENGKDFSATQEMSEELRQEVAYQGAFGTDGPVLRRIRPADEGTVSFSVILLKQGVSNQMNNEALLKQMRDFDIQTKPGSTVSTQGDKTIAGTINGGGADFDLRTHNGNIYLRKEK